MTPTHKRRARTARCVQYDGDNLLAMQEMMPQAQLLPINGDILVRRPQPAYLAIHSFIN